MHQNLRTRLHRRLLALLVSWLLAAIGAASAANAQPNEQVSEQALSAALLYNFIKFTEWPEPHSGHEVLQVCVSSTNQDLFAAIQKLDKRKVRNQSLLTTRYREQDDCDVIFSDTRPRWLALSGKHRQTALTVGSYAGFVADGGMIELSLQEDKARFDINLAAVKRTELRLYPQLLKLARRVVE